MTTPVKETPLKTTGGNLYAGMKRAEAEKKGVQKQFDFWDLNRDKVISEGEVKTERIIKGNGKFISGLVSCAVGGFMTAAGIFAEAPSLGTSTALIAGGGTFITAGAVTTLNGVKIIGDTFTHNKK